MIVFRLSKKKYAFELSGKGASKSNNRWNSKGTEVIYTAESRALAMAEVAVHLTLATLPNDYVMIEIEIPSNLVIQQIHTKNLKAGWNANPHTQETQKIGDNFINLRKAIALQVPSAVVKGDFNFLINPYHKDFNKVKIIKTYDFPFDERLFYTNF